MAELRETHTIFGPFLDWDPLDTAVLFLRTNRYEITTTRMAERSADNEPVPLPEAEPPEEVIVELTASRGTPGRGWTTSNLAELPTKLELTLEANSVRLSYVVTTTGQRLSQDEREFWKREARAIEDYLLTEGAIPNLFADESLRAAEVRKEFVVMGLWIGGVVAVIIFVVFAFLLT